MIEITSSGDYKKTKQFLDKMERASFYSDLRRYGEIGVDSLTANTPVDSFKTAASWNYRIVATAKSIRIEWYNTNLVNDIPIAILIQYGHATRGGTYISGRDFINPAMKPVFDQISDDIWKKVKLL